jgi:hypothetical protein
MFLCVEYQCDQRQAEIALCSGAKFRFDIEHLVISSESVSRLFNRLRLNIPCDMFKMLLLGTSSYSPSVMRLCTVEIYFPGFCEVTLIVSLHLRLGFTVGHSRWAPLAETTG